MGGLGKDVLTGGSGADVFVFDTTPGTGNVDRISDFDVTEDLIHLDSAYFDGLVAGTLSTDAFAANLDGNATTDENRIIYETDSGRLYFDLDSAGSGARVHIATLTAGLDLTSADFFVL